MIIEIPVKGSDEVVEVNLDELPDQPGDIIFILQEEEASRNLYLRFAAEYYKLGNHEAFMELVKEGSIDSRKFAIHDQQSPKDRVALINVLAAQHANAAANMKSSYEQKSSLMDQATMLYNQSDTIDVREPSTWIGKGFLLILQGRTEQAFYQFKISLDRNPNDVAALLGRASINFSRKRYRDALQDYQRALKLAPGFNPDIRFAIGLCWYKLQSLDRSKQAFEQIIKKNPQHVPAHVLLAILHLNKAKADPKGQSARMNVMKGIELLKSAQKIDKTQSVVLVFLADILFQKGDHDKSLILAQQALSNTDNREVQSLASYFIGRVYHAQAKFDEAFPYYLKAIQNNTDYRPAFYNLAQIYLRRGEKKLAAETLEKISPTDQDGQAYQLLAYLYSMIPEHHEKAIEMLKTVLSGNGEDLDSWIRYAQLQESRDITEAINAYEQANRILVDRGEISLQLMNNLAALFHAQGDLENAERAYEKAIEIFDATNMAESAQGNVLTTIHYNLSRLYERKEGTSEKAESTYRQIVERHPGYTDAFLRLGDMASKRGQHEEATALFEKARQADEKNADVWIMIGNEALAKHSYKSARISFERVLKKIDSHDTYCLVALGNDKLTAARSEQKPEVKDMLYKEATKFFDKVLRLDPRNVYAANGLGVAFAENGMLSEAKEVFTQVLEVQQDVQATHLNLAHVLGEMGQFRSAIALYEAADRKFGGGNDVQIILFTARAYYLMARADKSPEDMLQCIELNEKAFHLLPKDLALCFNLALSMQQFAQLVCDKPAEHRTVDDLVRAQTYLDSAKSHFSGLAANKDGPSKIGYDPQMAAQREKHCDYVRNNVIRKLTQQKANEELQREKLEELRRQREEEQRRREELEREEEEKRREQERQLLEERQRMYEQLIQTQQEMQQKSAVAAASAETEKKRKRRPKKVEAVETDKESENENSSGDDEQANDKDMEADEREDRQSTAADATKSKRQRRKLMKASSSSSRKNGAGRKRSFSEAADEDESANKRSNTGRPSQLSEAYVYDSSSDADSNSGVEPDQTEDNADKSGSSELTQPKTKLRIEDDSD